jgi:hypothetical protein
MQQEPWRVQEPRQPTDGDDGGAALQIVCAWCQQPLRRHRAQTPARFTTSYSICARCYGDVLRESADSPGSMARTPCVAADRMEGRARHLPEKRQGKSFLALLIEDIHQRAKAICREAMIIQQRSQDMIHMSQRARHMRQAERVERAVGRDHRPRV